MLGLNRFSSSQNITIFTKFHQWVLWKCYEQSHRSWRIVCFQMVMEVVLRTSPVVSLDTFLTSPTYRFASYWAEFCQETNCLFVCSGRSLRAPCRSTGSWTRTEGWGFPTLVTHHRPTSCNFIILILILKTKNRLWSWFSQTDGQTGVAQRHYASNHRLARWTMIMIMKSWW